MKCSVRSFHSYFCFSAFQGKQKTFTERKVFAALATPLPAFYPVKDSAEGKSIIHFCDVTTKCILMVLYIMPTFIFQLFTLYFFFTYLLTTDSKSCGFSPYRNALFQCSSNFSVLLIPAFIILYLL